MFYWDRSSLYSFAVYMYASVSLIKTKIFTCPETILTGPAQCLLATIGLNPVIYSLVLYRVPAELHIGSVLAGVQPCLGHLHGVLLVLDGLLEVSNVVFSSADLITHLGKKQKPILIWIERPFSEHMDTCYTDNMVVKPSPWVSARKTANTLELHLSCTNPSILSV